MGPPDEKSAIVSVTVVAATVIASGAFAGELIEPYPYWSNWLSAAITGTTPACAAASIAWTTKSRCGEISGSPIERLITFIPSATADSIAAAI